MLPQDLGFISQLCISGRDTFVSTIALVFENPNAITIDAVHNVVGIRKFTRPDAHPSFSSH